MRSLVLLPLLFAALPAYGQDVPVTPEAPVTPLGEDEDELLAADNEILVVATRVFGQVEAPQPPILTLDEEEIASYGADSLTDLLAQLSPQTGSGRGRGEGGPVILLNGRRISSFREMRDLPPEAIRRMEVLPEEVALRFGYAANQRVVNFILKDNFTSKTVAGEYNVPTRGGFAESELEAGMVKIDGDNRFNIHAKMEDTTSLTEAELNVIQQEQNIPTVATDLDPAEFRTLVDKQREYSLNATWSTGLGEGAGAGSLTLNGAATRSNTRSLFGLDTVRLTAPDGSTSLRSLDDPLVRDSQTTTLEGGVTYNQPLGGWQLTATANASHSDTDTEIDREADLSGLVAAAQAGTLNINGLLPVVAGAGRDTARTRDLSLNSLVTASGTPFRLPAGEATLTVKGGYSYSRSDNRDSRTAGGGRTVLDRGIVTGGINLGLPIASRREEVLAGLGDISLNLSAGVEHFSDFGTLKDWSAGITWAPTEKLSFQASYLVDEAAPSLAFLGNPQIIAPNSTVYDFTRGEAALVTVINGGNPNLRQETQRDIKLAANWQLPFLDNRSNLVVEYFRNRSSDVTQSFPLLTPAIEAAFPGRVVRDASGRLVSIDRRPVTFDEIESSRLRWGFNISGSIGEQQAEAGRGAMGDGARGAGRGAGGPGGGRGMGPRGPGGFGRGPGGGRGRWNLSLYHTYRFSETIQIAPTGPVLDLLDGDAIAAGGVARHSLELEGGLFHKGFGLRLNGSWTAPTTVNGSGAPGSSDLRFGSVTTLDARIFVNFDQKPKIVEAIPFLKGTRLSFEVDNIFDSRQRVTDGSGVVPISYQADFRDPRGRFVGIDIRKMF